MIPSGLAFSLEHAADDVRDALRKVDRTISALEHIASALELQTLCAVAETCKGVAGNVTYGVLLDRAQDILHPVKSEPKGNIPYRGDK